MTTLSSDDFLSSVHLGIDADPYIPVRTLRALGVSADNKTLLTWEKAGTFPQRRHIHGASHWKLSDVASWLGQRAIKALKDSGCAHCLLRDALSNTTLPRAVKARERSNKYVNDVADFFLGRVS